MSISQQELGMILRKSLRAFMEFNPEITASRILVLLEVLNNPGVQQQDLPKLIRPMSPTAGSRNTMEWLAIKAGGVPGPGFIEQQPDPHYRKRNLLYPTPRAQQWLAALAQSINLSGDRPSDPT